MPRLHHIDALRALAFGLLIAYHLAMLYVQDWGWHLKSRHLSEAMQMPMLFVNRWRMDLIFLVSGVSAALLMAREPGGFLRRRSWRLLLPLAFGVVVIVPVQPYCQGVANGLVEPGYLTFLARYFTGYPWPRGAFDGWEYGFTWNHLWYLVYLWVYTVALVLLRRPLAALGRRAVRLRGARLLLWPAAWIFLLTVLLQPHFPHRNNLIEDWYAHALYFSMFVFGWWLGRDQGLWEEFARLARPALAAALAVFAVYLAWVRFRAGVDDLHPLEQAGIWLARNLYIWLALSAILGWSRRLLDRPFRWLPWANESVYPWYILHQSLIVLIAYWVVPMKLPAMIEIAVVGGGTVMGCWVLTDALVRRVGSMRPLFGLEPQRPSVLHARPSGPPPVLTVPVTANATRSTAVTSPACARDT